MNELQKWLSFRPWQRHGLVLMVGGLVYISHGVSLVAIGDLSERREQALVVALNMMPLSSWSFLFIVAGVLACISSRWPAFAESWGYMVLCGLSSGWSAVYLIGFFFNDHLPLNISYGLMWGMMGFMWWAINGLMNPDKLLEVIPDGAD